MSRRRGFHLSWGGRFLPPFGDAFVSIEALSGIVLIAGAAAAICWTNVDAGSYERTWGHVLTLGVGDAAIDLDLRHWVNDGLMTIFFFVVGLEIKREIVAASSATRGPRACRRSRRSAAWWFPRSSTSRSTPDGAGGRGWAIPMATDIAFAVGVLAILGPRVPPALKLFLLTLAIVDDIGAIIVIALFYSRGSGRDGCSPRP